MTVPRRPALRVGAAAALLVLTACSAPLTPDDQPEAQPDPSPAQTSTSRPTPTPTTPVATPTPTKAIPKPPSRPVRSVVAISVDALNPSALTRLGRARLPHFFAMIDNGASTLNARTELEQTETLPNHTGMLTGRPVEGPAGHHVDFNQDPGRVTVGSHAGRPIASVFDVVHQHRGTTAMYASKTKFALFQRSWAASIDRSVIIEDNTGLVDRLVSDLTEAPPPTFSFVHLSAPDVAGHASGFMGPAYLEAVRRTDTLLGRIRTAMTTSPRLRKSYLVVTADHGGRGKHGHTAAADPDDYRIPFLVDGPGVPDGADLYELNPDYGDPGTGRPSYDGAQPVRNADVADLTTRLLGLPPVPGSVLGAVHQLDVR